MKSSGISSAKESPGPRSSGTLPSSTPPREAGPRQSFALTGPSARLDPRTHAVRGDLADVRLADRVFAPHYAAAVPCAVARATPLLDKVDGGDAIAALTAGDLFEMLELTSAHAWGVAPGAGLVGYCDRAALSLA